jgi:formate-dependent nitrite reductase membrane component NrfD
MNANQSSGVIIAVAVLAALLSAALWDIYAYASAANVRTVSSVLGGWARQFPIFAVAIGVILGHLFWPPDNGGTH